ncbi:hypothetical protein HMPREF1565_2932 [Providencia alcalifaciens RIMD 1656011]|nr:hypothetical protein HMPREF1565_2932 [Providencia alcalifaciens RIMD 1656011]
MATLRLKNSLSLRCIGASKRFFAPMRCILAVGVKTRTAQRH